MNPFNPEDFYSTQGVNNQFQENINLKPPGIELTAQYLNNKYNTNITYSPCILACIGKIIKLSQLKHQRTHYRQAFIIQKKANLSVFIAYVQENNEEAIVYCNSSGSDETWAIKLAEDTYIQVYTSKNITSNTPYLSHIDALVLARDVIRKNTDGNYYDIQNLIDLLKSRSFECRGYKGFRMPVQLLKTSPLSFFILTEKDRVNASQKIYKNQTLTEFTARYSHKNEPTYIQEKSIKYAGIIQLQFYLNEIEKVIGRKLPFLYKREYIVGAKNTLASGIDLHNFAKYFLDSLSKSAIRPFFSEVVSNPIFNKKDTKQPTATLPKLPSCAVS